MAVTLELTTERLETIREEQSAKNRPYAEQAYLHVDNGKYYCFV